MATETVNITTTLADDSVTNAKLAEMNARTIKLRATGTGLGNPIDGSPDQASEILDFATDPFVRTSALPSGGGDVVGPASSVDANIALFDGLTGKLIQDAGINLSEIIEEDPGPGVGLIDSGAGVSPIVLKNLKDGLGTQVVSNTGSVQVDIDFTAADRYYYSDGSALPVEGTITSAGRDLLDDANAAAQRTTLGLGTAATANTGDFDAAGAAAAAQAASQPLDSDLTAIAGLSPSNDDVIQRKAGAWTNRSLAQLLSDFLFTTIGLAYGRLPNPSAVTFPRQNADNTVTSRTASEMRTDLGLGTWALENLTTTAVTRLATYASGSQAFSVLTLADVAGTTFTFPSTGWYEVEWRVTHDAAATSTGAWFSLNGTAVSNYLAAIVMPNVLGTDRSSLCIEAYDQGGPAASSAVTSGNRALIKATINVTTVGTIYLRCASEVNASAITVTNVDGWMKLML